MDRGLYTATSGGLLADRRIDLVGHNLANVNTVGYKAQRLVSRQQEFADTLAATLPNQDPESQADHARTPGVITTNSVTDFSPGPMSVTGNPLHVALEGKNEFFVVQTPEGEAYTKAGNFTINSDGEIVTPDGFQVMGEGGPIVANGSNINIGGDGSVFVDGNRVGKLRVAEIPELKLLERAEGTRFKLPPGGQQAGSVENVKVITGTLEMANVQVVDAMVDMINAQKTFESYAKTVQTISELNDISLRTSRSIG